MVWKGRSRKTVFLLGAGATRGAVRHVIINGKRIKAPLNADFFRVVETFVRAHGDRGGVAARFERLRRVFCDEFPSRGSWPIPMETAFSLLYVLKDFPEVYAKRLGRRRDVGSRTEIEDFLRLTFAVLGAIEKHAPEDNLYSHLVSRLDPKDTIITLNYDTLLDGALIRSGWDPGKGYSLIGGNRKLYWKMPRPEKRTTLSDIQLLKLHGSLNWLVRGSYQNMRRVFDSKPSRVVISRKPRTNETKKFIRQIVPPIYGKFFNHLHWRTLWKHAFEAVTEAEVLVVIGCSLVDTDFHLLGMLSHAIKGRKDRQANFVASILVDKVKVRRKWQRILRGCVSQKIGFKSFAEFCKRIK